MKRIAFLTTAVLLLFSCSGKTVQDKEDAQEGTPATPGLPVAVDLGLSVKWANTNLGATAPEEYGDYYAWGEIENKKDFSWKSYKWAIIYPTYYSLSKYNYDGEYGTVDNKRVLDAADDTAHVKLGGKWRMPTRSEVDELVSTSTNSSYKWEWKSLNGHPGWSVTYLAKNQSVFFPAAGFKGEESAPFYVGEAGYYWSTALYTGPLEGLGGQSPESAWHLNFFDDTIRPDYGSRQYGFSIRAVTE